MKAYLLALFIALAAFAPTANASPASGEFGQLGQKFSFSDSSGYAYAKAGLSGGRRYQLLFSPSFAVVGALKIAPDLVLDTSGGTWVPNGSVMTLGATINFIDANEIQTVEFFSVRVQDGVVTSLGTTSAAFGYQRAVTLNDTEGAYQLKVRLTDTNGTITDSPAVSIQLINSTVVGAFEGITGPEGARKAVGWACSTGYAQALTVSLVTGDMQTLASGTAALASEAAINQQCKSNGTAFRFAIPITSSMEQNYSNAAIFVSANPVPAAQAAALLPVVGAGYYVINWRPILLSANIVELPRYTSGYVIGEPILVSAELADEDGVVVSADFYRVGQSGTICPQSFAPASPVVVVCEVASFPVGTHQIVVTPTDNRGAIGRQGSSPLPVATVSVVSPTPVLVSASVTGTTTYTVNVSGSNFFTGGVSLRVLDASGSTLGDIAATPTNSGSVSVPLSSAYKAAYDTGGIKLQVLNPTPGHPVQPSWASNLSSLLRANQPPTVSFISPNSGSTFIAGRAIGFEVSALADQGVQKVEFRSAATNQLIAPAVTSPPYQVTWTPPQGVHTVIARAYSGTQSGEASVQVAVASAPAVTLPTRDVESDRVGSTAGEFRIDESGNTTYRIPIAVVPGTAGVAPQLALAYSSQGGTSPIGKGWTLAGQSAITRCRKTREAGDFISNGVAFDGDSLPVQFTSADAFCLDGQRLIAVDTTNVEYRLELDPWTRITAIGGGADTGPAHFRVERKDGSTSEYGNSDDSRIARNQCSGTCATTAWALNRVEDSTGNYLTWHYARYFSGIAVVGSGPVDEFLPSEVRYTGKRNLVGQSGSDLSPYARVLFGYETLPNVQIGRGWQGGSTVSQTQRLAWIKVQDPFAAAPRTVRYYGLTSETSESNSGMHLLRSVTECNKGVGDVGVDSSTGTAPVCYRPTTFTHSSAKHEYSANAQTSVYLDINDRHGARIGDVDGDGRNDLVWVKNVNESGTSPPACTTSRIFVSYGDRTFAGSTSQLTLIAPAQPGVCTGRDLQDLEDSWQLLDYDGDGRDDLMMATAAGPLGQWKIHKSLGRPENGSKAFDDTVDLLGGIKIPVSDEKLRLAQLLDLNGDGLLDVIYPAAVAAGTSDYGALKSRLRERYSTSPTTSALRFGAEATIDFSFSVGDDCRIRRTEPDSPTRCDLAFHQSPESRFVTSDFDGDGRGDLMLLVGRRYESGGQLPDDELALDTQFVDAQTLVEAAADPASNFVEYTMHWYFFASRTQGASVGFEQVSQLPVWDPTGTRGPALGGDLPLQSGKIRLADFNGDGLTDLLYRRIESSLPDSWRLRQNTGRGFTSVPADLSGVKNSDYAQVADVNGDGRADLLYPPDSDSCAGEPANGTRPFCVRQGLSHMLGVDVAKRVPGGGAASIPANGSLGDFDHFFADFDGDGSSDFLRLHHSSGINGVYTSRSATRHQARDVIVEIQDGLGARTVMTYAPLTNASVYRRDANSLLSASYGRGSPVHDLLAPIYVVSKVESSAPEWNDPAAMAQVSYRYAGGKMQSGGRGFLGFREIASFDGVYSTSPAKHVATLTTYRQDFPFVGRPARTETRVITGPVSYGGAALDACRDDPEALAQSCFYQNGLVFPAAGGQRVSAADSHWSCQGSQNDTSCAISIVANVCGVSGGDDKLPLQIQQPLFPFLAGSRDETFSFESGTRLAVTESGFCYQTDYGNLTYSKVSRRDGNDAELAVQTTTNAYDNLITAVSSNRPLWRLGRLRSTQVDDSRPDPAQPGQWLSKSRLSDFEYELTSSNTSLPNTGFLTSERVQKDVGPDQDLRTLYTLDPFGNKTHVFTCSAYEADGSKLTDTECRAVSRIVQRPTGPGGPTVSVHRYARSTFDSIGRYVTAAYSPYYSPAASNQLVERASLTVTARDEFGHAVQQTGANGTASFARFGALGRPFAAADQTGKSSVVRYRWCTDVGCPSGAIYRSETVSAGAPTQWVYHDVLGRAQLSVAASFEAGITGKDFSATCAFFDRKNRSERTSTPFFLTSPSVAGAPSFGSDPCTSRNWSTVKFDVLGRVITTTEPDGATTSTTYDGLTTTVVNAKGQIAKEEKNPLGETVRVIQANPDNGSALGLIVHSQYGPDGKVISVTRNAGRGNIVTSYEYDLLGRVTRTIDPDRGTEQAYYNAAGEVIRATRAAGNDVWSFYDASGRLWRRETGDITDEWTYDTAANGLGAVHMEERTVPGKPTYRRTFNFDGFSRPSSRATLVDGTSYVEGWFYDSFGRQHRTQDANGGVLEQVYNSRGYPWQLRNAANTSEVYQQVLELNERGQMTRALRGSTNVNWVYNPLRGWLDALQSGSGNSLQNLSYGHDVLGNLESRTDLRANQTDAFTYDALNRLKTATTHFNGSAPVTTLNLQYDVLGNICSKNGRSYSYAGLDNCNSVGTDAGASPHAVTQVGTDLYQYSAGLLTAATTPITSSNRTFQYNGLEQLETVTVGSLSAPNAELELRYGPSGERFWREEKVGSATTLTRTVGNVEYITRPTGVIETKRYVGGVLIETTFSNGAASTQHFLFHDALGSIDVITDALGTVKERLSFNPHGERRSALDWRAAATGYVPSNTTRGFTGHEHLDVFGLVHMNGRVYEPTLGRFIQADPVLDSGIQGLNRFSYVLNNPLTFTDPSGHWSVPNWVRAVVAIAITYYTGGYAASIYATNAGGAFAVVVAGGFAAGAVQSGSLEGGMYGAFSSAIFFGVGQLGGGSFEYGFDAQTAGRIVAHGIAGGVMSDLQGGKFGHGFLSAGLADAASPYLRSSGFGKGVVASAILGGTVSAATGGKFANGAATSAFSYAFGSVARRQPVTGAAGEGNAVPVEVPDSVKVEASGFATREDAARAAGARYGAEGVKREQELQIGLTRISKGNWGYLTPGWGPKGATIVDPNPLLEVYRDARLHVGAWMHGHFDVQSNFSATDFTHAWERQTPTYLVNSAGQVRVLTDAHLREGLSAMRGSTLPQSLRGLRAYYRETGIPGDEL